MKIDKKFELLLTSMKIPHLKFIINMYNDNCKKLSLEEETKKTQKEFYSQNKMKGYSGLNKLDLVRFIKNHFSDDEIIEYYNLLGPKLLYDLINESISLILGEHKIERLKEINLNELNVKIKIKGYTWDIETLIEQIENEENENNFSFFEKCDCKIGQDGGICKHIILCYLILYCLYNEDNVIEIKFPFKLNDDSKMLIDKDIDLIRQQINIIKN